MPPVIHNIISAASVLLLFSAEVEASRPDSLGGDVLVAVEPKHYQRVSSKDFSSPGSQHEEGHVTMSNGTGDANAVNSSAEGHLEEHLANTVESHLSRNTGEDPADDVESRRDLAEKTRAVESHEAIADPGTVLISRHPSPSAAKIHVVAITNLPNDGRVSVLKQSLLAGGFGTDFFLYNTGNDFNWTQRLQIEQHIVEDAAHEDPEAVFLFIDAFDVFTLGSPEEILRKFQQAGQDALFSCVTYPYPHDCKGFDWKNDGQCNKVSHWGAECPHWCRFACGGAFMGKAGVLAQIFAENPFDDASDDQCYFNMVLAKRSYNIAIDYRHEVFFSTTDLLQCSLERKGGRLLVTNTGTLPSVFHFDATHPTAEHLESFWMDAIQNRSGPLCTSTSSCTEWCWDWDFGDMTARITASDAQLLTSVLHGNPREQGLGRHTLPCVVLGVLVAALFAGIIYVRNFSAIKKMELRKETAN